MIKKLIAFLLTAAMLASSAMMAYADETGETVKPEISAEEALAAETESDEAVEPEITGKETAEVKNTADPELYTSLKEEIGLLKTLGIMTNVTSDNIKETIPRGKFVEHILKLINLGAAKSEGMAQYFSDVAPGSEYYDTITTAAMVGLIHGSGEGEFAPSRPVTYNEALKMIVGALDYTAVAEARGGYTRGYIAVANDLKLTKNITAGYSSELTNAQAVVLLYNALNSNAAEMNMNSDKSVSMSSSDRLFLEDKFKVEKRRGVVTGTQLTRQLEGKDYIGYVEIDGEEYKVAASEYYDEEDLLGMSVYYYVQYKDDVTGDVRDAKIIMISPMPERNTVIDVVDEDIDPTTSVTTFRYYDANDRETSKSITNATIYYNGRNCEGYLAPDGSDLTPAHGKVRLIDNNRDGKIEFVIVESYEEYVVDYGATTKIATKYGGGEINVDSDDIIMQRGGVTITADYLGEWESIRVMMCKNGGGIIRAYNDDVSGIIQSVNDEEIKINDTVYEYADVYAEALKNKHYQAFTDKRGSTVTIALNEDGKVVGVTATTTDVTEYGYLVKAVNEGGLDPINKVKIYCQYGTMSIYDCADNIKVNGRKVEGNIEDCFRDSAGVFRDQLIKYTKKNDKVTAIYTAVDTTNGQENAVGPADNENFSLNYQKKNSAWEYTNGTNKLESNYVVLASQIPIFWIPKDLTEESLFAYYDAASSLSGLSKSTELYIYDARLIEPNYNIYLPTALVIKDNTEREGISNTNPYILSSITNGSNYYAVKLIETTLDGSGNEVYQITAQGGTVIGFEAKVYNVDTTNLYGYGSYTLADLEVGDLIQVGYGNDNSKANRFVVLGTAADYSNEDGELKWWTNDRSNNSADIFNSPGTNNSMLYGEIIRTKDANGEDEFIMTTFGTTYPNKTGAVYVYERNSKRISTATSNQLAAGKRIFMNIKNGYIGSFAIVSTD